MPPSAPVAHAPTAATADSCTQGHDQRNAGTEPRGAHADRRSRRHARTGRRSMRTSRASSPASGTNGRPTRASDDASARSACACASSVSTQSSPSTPSLDVGRQRGSALVTPTCMNPHRLTAAGELVPPVLRPYPWRPLILRGVALGRASSITFVSLCRPAQLIRAPRALLRPRVRLSPCLRSSACSGHLPLDVAAPTAAAPEDLGHEPDTSAGVAPHGLAPADERASATSALERVVRPPPRRRAGTAFVGAMLPSDPCHEIVLSGARFVPGSGR